MNTKSYANITWIQCHVTKKSKIYDGWCSFNKETKRLIPILLYQEIDLHCFVILG